MPKLIKQISARVLDFLESESAASIVFEAQIGDEDYFELTGFIGYTQNFTQAGEVEQLNSSAQYGLTVNNNKTFIELNTELDC